MKIMDFLNEKAVTVDIKAKDKESLINEMVDLLVSAGEIKDKNGLVKVLLEREALGSTGIGQGVGIPHAKFSKVKKLMAAFAISKKGVDFDSLDGELTHIFVLLVAPEDSAGPHLKALARISRLLKDKYFRDALLKVKDDKELIKVISQEDQKKY